MRLDGDNSGGLSGRPEQGPRPETVYSRRHWRKQERRARGWDPSALIQKVIRDECSRRKYLELLRIDSYGSGRLNTQINQVIMERKEHR